MKKGFTLIELLAVIAILAIIILIAVPTIINIINNSRKNTFESSAKNIVDGALLEHSKKVAAGDITPSTIVIEGGVVTSGTLDVSGKLPEEGKIKIDEKGNSVYALYDGKFCAEKRKNLGFTVSEIAETECIIDEEAPQVVFGGSVLSGETVTATINVADNKSGIDKIEYQWAVTTTPVEPNYVEVPNNTEVTNTTPGESYLIVKTTDQEANEEVFVEGPFVVTSAYDIIEGVNKPDLSTGMIAVKWNGTNWIKVADPIADKSWYDYSTTGKQWANAVYVTSATRSAYQSAASGTTINMTDIVQFLVWIPRYAYQISSGYHTATAGNINIKFLVDDTNSDISGTEYTETPTYSGSSQTNYIVHSGFKFGTDNLKGFWVIKFEPSNDGSGNIESLPFKVAYNSNNVSNIFNINYNMRLNTTKYGFTANEVDTHMSKPTEWGAIAYLSKSAHGKNSEVFINNSSNFSTGCGGNLVNSPSFAGCQNQYHTALGVEASTTGNIYGVYDMNGGLYEYMAAYVNNGNAALATYASNLVSASSKYKVLYTPGSPDSDSNNYIINNVIKGDNIYEVSSTNGDGTGWYSDRMYIPNTSAPFFGYGGWNGYGSSSGIFSVINPDGSGNVNNTFRTILVVN